MAHTGGIRGQNSPKKILRALLYFTDGMIYAVARTRNQIYHTSQAGRRSRHNIKKSSRPVTRPEHRIRRHCCCGRRQFNYVIQRMTGDYYYWNLISTLPLLPLLHYVLVVMRTAVCSPRNKNVRGRRTKTGPNRAQVVGNWPYENELIYGAVSNVNIVHRVVGIFFFVINELCRTFF